VTNAFALDSLKRIKDQLASKKEALKASYTDQLASFCKAVLAGKPELKRSAEELLLAKKIAEQFQTPPEKMESELTSLIKELKEAKPGLQTPKSAEIVKGLIRETEEDRVWSLAGAKPSEIIHLRSPLYTTDSKYVEPLRTLFEQLNPSLVTVAYDSEATGPATHHKVLKAVRTALQQAQFPTPPKIWGYRNVWDRFRFSEANYLYPVSDSELNELHKTFLDCYGSQRQASFPSPAYDGPFSGYVLELLAQQKEELETLLGESFFDEHPDPRVRQAKGFILLKEMTLEQFLKERN
jgi:glucosamine-6-phosphate deaminase